MDSEGRRTWAGAGPPSGEQFELSHGDQRATVVEVGGGIRCYTEGSRPLLDGYSGEEMCSGGRGQPLIPWPNRLRDGRYEFGGERLQLALSEPERGNAIHGLVRWASWSLVERAPARVVLGHVLHPRPGYPFALRLHLEYELSPLGLTVTTRAQNVGAKPCPYGAGAHPYLAPATPLVDDAVLTVPAREWLRTDERGIPCGSAPVEGTAYDFRRPRPIGPSVLDTAYTGLERDADGRARVELSGADGAHRVSLWVDEGYRYVMVFTGDTLAPGRRRRGLAVEPMTCAPNAFRSGEGLRVLEPGEEWSCRWGVTAPR